jgi:hypothetical protein
MCRNAILAIPLSRNRDNDQFLFPSGEQAPQQNVFQEFPNAARCDFGMTLHGDKVRGRRE